MAAGSRRLAQTQPSPARVARSRRSGGTCRIDCRLPFRIRDSDISPFLRRLRCIGSNVERFSCPHCEAIDRERHLRLFLDRLRIMERMRGGTVLHMAPEYRLRGYIENHDLRIYVRGDLNLTAAGVERVDLQQIPYPHETFDLVICNHMLEHVDNACLRCGKFIGSSSRADEQFVKRPMRRSYREPSRSHCSSPPITGCSSMGRKTMFACSDRTSRNIFCKRVSLAASYRTRISFQRLTASNSVSMTAFFDFVRV